MKKLSQLAFLGILAFSACQKNAIDQKDLAVQPFRPKLEEATPRFSDAKVNGQLVNNIGNAPLDNKITDDGAQLGRVLFYDQKLSKNNRVSCASCHQQSAAFSDPFGQFSTGFGGAITPRNASTILNPAFKLSYFWDGRERTLESMTLRPIENHIEMGIEEFSALTKKLEGVDYYPALFEKAFGDPAITKDRIGQAMAQFLRSMTSADSKFDRVQKNQAQFTPLEKMGSDLFHGWDRANCASCHNTAVENNGWEDRANIGLDENYTDKGIKNLGNSEGIFTVPSLRNVSLTAPYMHDGRFKSLFDVVEHYNSGIKKHKDLDWRLRGGNDIIIMPPNGNPNGGDPEAPRRLNLSDVEKQALVAFLQTLSDPRILTDPNFSDPFKI